MSCSVESGAELPQDDSLEIEIIKQNFSLLPEDAKINLKNYLQNLVVMQKVMGEVAVVVDSTCSLSNDG